MTTHTIADFLTEAEQSLSAASPPGFITCDPCQDFRTDVSFGIEHSCRRCQPMRFLSWRPNDNGEGLRVLVDGMEASFSHHRKADRPSSPAKARPVPTAASSSAPYSAPKADGPRWTAWRS